MQVTRTFDLLEKYGTELPNKPDVFAAKQNRQWVKFSTKDYIENSNLMSYGLLAMSLKKGDAVATISNNRPEWNFADMGLAQAGLIHVPLFTTLTQEGYKGIFEHAQVKAVFVSDKKLYDLIKPIAPDLIFTFDQVDSAPNWTAVRDLGKEKASEFSQIIEETKKQTLATDPVTLIYTSGTTGNSKGILLSHQNLMTTAIAAASVFQLKSDQRYLSILPICHVGERMGCYQTQYSGCSIYYAESTATIARDLKEVQPHGFGAVPRILEKVYDKIVDKGRKLSGIKKTLFFWALDLGLRYKIDGSNGWWYAIQLKLANKLIFSKWREAMGGNVVSIGVGGAALQPRLERVFWAAGIKLLNMYGLTETAPIITINRQQLPDLRLGTVGSVIEGVEVKIAPDGEILCKGPNVMLGYFKDERATSEVMDSEGWFHTGDIGVLDDGKFLRITDRKKELFKLSNGKYVSPQVIENLFKESLYIDQLMVIGEGEKFTSALISPNFEALTDWCNSRKIDASNRANMIKDKEVDRLFQEIVKEQNKGIGADEQIKRFRVVADEWTIESDELSPTLKLKRRVLSAKYTDLIKDIFNKED
ncbi:MAG: long-chain fatty acid--CoA ligase [Flavobacteriales bacterium]|nr:long-chain fatty acid--CoA ligase [Flavobacteriales bacterium]